MVIGGAGFLLAVLWFDLMFDVQVRGHDGAVLPDEVLASISSYYRRVTTDAAPMNRFVGAGMVVMLVGVAAQAVAEDLGAWSAVSALLAVPPVVLAAARVVPDAVRLGGRGDEPAMQSRLARRIYRAHVYCFASISLLVVTQAVAAAAT